MASSQFPESDNGPKPKSIPSLAVNFPHLAAFLAWTPPTMNKALGSTASASTRAPAYWDMHLSDDLILKRIVHLPSLPETLAALVDDSLSKSSTGEILGHLDVWIRQRANALPVSSIVRDEKDVVAFYEEHIAQICSRIASNLEFGQGPIIFEWTDSHRHGGKNQIAEDSESTDLKPQKTAQTDGPTNVSAKAIADGFFRVFLDSENFENDVASLPANKKEDLRAIRRHFVNLAVWEFKSIVAGDKKTMDAINALIGRPFHWQKCSEETSCSSATHLERTGIPKVTRVRTGPDPTETPWTLPEPGSVVDSMPDGTILFPEVKTCKKRKNSKRPRKNHGKTESQTPEVKARWIVQQAWAEAVQSDTTSVVIQSGNFEFIGIRHRASQTLYLTDLLHATTSTPKTDKNPGARIPYAKVHVGLYIATLRDAVNRALQISDYETRNVPFPYIGDVQDAPAVEPHTAYDKPKEWFMVQHEVTMAVRFYDKDRIHTPVKYLRAPSDLDSGMIPFQKFGDPSTTILVTFGRQRMGMVFEAKIDLYGRPLIPKAVVKFAVGHSSWSRLEKEYHTCSDLARRGVKGIVSTLGLFENEKQAMKVLVMEDGGWPIAGEERMSTKIRTAFKTTLAEIHRAGYLHNDLSSTALLVNSIGKVTTCMVGFVDCALMENDGRLGGVAATAASEAERLEDILNGLDREDGDSGLKRRRIA